MHKVLRIEYDPDPTCPMENDGSWTLVSFIRRHAHFQDSDKYLRVTRDGIVPANVGLRSKARAGFFYVLDYYEHGEGRWSFRGHGAQCRWDTSRYAGVLLWNNPPGDMGAKTPEDRAKDAQAFLDEYNAWANGYVYGYTVETPDGEHLDSCWGFCDVKYMLQEVNLEPGDKVVIKGDASGAVHGDDLPAGVIHLKRFDDDEDEEAEAFAWACRS